MKIFPEGPRSIFTHYFVYVYFVLLPWQNKMILDFTGAETRDGGRGGVGGPPHDPIDRNIKTVSYWGPEASRPLLQHEFDLEPGAASATGDGWVKQMLAEPSMDGCSAVNERSQSRRELMLHWQWTHTTLTLWGHGTRLHLANSELKHVRSQRMRQFSKSELILAHTYLTVNSTYDLSPFALTVSHCDSFILVLYVRNFEQAVSYFMRSNSWLGWQAEHGWSTMIILLPKPQV